MRDKKVERIFKGICTLLLAGVLTVISACASRVQTVVLPSKTTTEYIYKDSTVYVEVPYEVIKEVLVLPAHRDTTSVLETSVATSLAKVQGGTLQHTLKNKGGNKLNTTIQYVEKIVIDSIAYPVEVPVSIPPTFSEKLNLALRSIGGFICLVGFVWLACVLVKRFVLKR